MNARGPFANLGASRERSAAVAPDAACAFQRWVALERERRASAHAIGSRFSTSVGQRTEGAVALTWRDDREARTSR
jgi:hypothetical protein